MSCNANIHLYTKSKALVSGEAHCVNLVAREFEHEASIFIGGATADELRAIADAINKPLERMRAETAASETLEAAE